MSRRPTTRAVLVAGLLVALLLAGVVSMAASSSPDGLERVAGDQGFAERERASRTADGPLADYRADGVADGRLAGGLAGVVGTVVVLVLAGGLFWVVRRREPEST